MKPLSDSKTLAELEAYLNVESSLSSDLTKPIHHMSLDSRQIEQGDLFIAVQGERNHGLDFLASVLAKQPAAIITDRHLSDAETLCLEQEKIDVSVYVVSDIESRLGGLANWFYDQPSKRLKVIGITGTNGKTSSAFFTAQLLASNGQEVAIMGTLGNGRLGKLSETKNTTPNAIQVHRLLAEFLNDGVDWVVMEVSSHALCLGRVEGVVFNCVALTQVTRDHLDFHGSEQAYQEAKRLLFTDYQAEHRVLNAADTVGSSLHQQLAENHRKHLWLYNPDTERLLEAPSAGLQLQSAELTVSGIQGVLCFDGQQESFKAALLGRFNIENMMCALSILLANGFALQTLCKQLQKLKSVAGRMQIVGQKPTVIVDFAHTPDALAQILMATSAHLDNNEAQLGVVFGCGGNRDMGKRPLMGAVAEEYADTLMITSDNPRDESPEKIIDAILKGLKHPSEALVEVDRAKAIKAALISARPQDVVVVAGKGHEDYQEIKGVKLPYSDISMIEAWFEDRCNSPK